MKTDIIEFKCVKIKFYKNILYFIYFRKQIVPKLKFSL